MTTEITRKTWFQFHDWLNFGTTETIKTNDNLREVTNLAQGTSFAWSINLLRESNLGKIWEKINEKIEGREIYQLESPKDAINFINEASKESDPELQEKWANLLANWLKWKTNIWRYIEILWQLWAIEVQFLDTIFAKYLQKKQENRSSKEQKDSELIELNNKHASIFTINNVLFTEYINLNSSWKSVEAQTYRNQTKDIQELFSQIEELESSIEKLKSEIFDMENPDFNAKDIYINYDLWEIIDTLKRFNLIQNAYGKGISVGSETLVSSNKFRFQLTDLWVAFIKACR